MTTAQYVTVVMDRYDGAGNPIVRGSASWIPSMDLPDPADMMLVGRAPIPATFRAGSLPQVRLIANDSIGPQGQSSPGWTWNLSYDGVPGNPADASYYLLTANGATQYLSELATVPAAQPGQQYLPLPSGIPAAGQVPAATGTGSASAWAYDGGFSTQYADQAAAQAAGVVSGNGMQQLWAAIAGRNSARCDIPVIGDSVTMPYGTTQWANGYVQQLNRAIRTEYPTTANGSGGGLGFIPIVAPTSGSATYTWPFTPQFGGAGTVNLGPVRQLNQVASEESWTWTAPAGTTSVRVMYYDNTAAGEFSYQVNSGAVTNVSNTSTEVEVLTAAISMASGDTLTIAWVSGYITVDGILHYAGDEDSGITFHACGHAGWTSANSPTGWAQGEDFGNWAQCYEFGFDNTVAIAIELGLNDAVVYDAATFVTEMEALIAKVRGSATALNNIPLVLIAAYQPDISVVDAGGWPAYVAALRTVAAASAPAIAIDLSYRMDPFGASGALQYDTEHPNDAGAAYVGEIVAAGVRIA